jgi:hypothetical protein
MKMDPRSGSVECGVHGSQEATFVCRHLVQSLREERAIGSWTAGGGAGSRPDAWCTACETKVQGTGGEWTAESEAFAGVSLLCGACYDRLRELNREA